MSDLTETDYLVVGAGAAGMAFTDALLTHSDATVTIVDRRHAPGGHWIDAYPFVRLHQPSAFYGVDSVPLGQDAIDRSGLNAGFYELATADELRAYFARVMQQHFLASGRVRYFPGSDYGRDPTGRHHFTPALTGVTREVRVRRKLVDTTYLEGSIPATSAPPFAVADGVRCIAAGELTRIGDRPERFVIVGAGKTALDTCVWLLAQGVPAPAIRWIKPREGWWLNRRYHQPHTYLPDFYAGVGLQLQAMAEAASVEDVLLRLESDGFLLRVDTAVMPTMCHGAIISEAELGLLRKIEDVVRMGRVRRIERDRIVLDGGTVPTDAHTLHVHCAAQGLARPALRPIFEADRVTVQPCLWGFACYQFALLGVVEATIERDDDKNRLCPPIAYWDQPADYLSAYLAAMAGEQARAAFPALATWARDTRLNPLSGIGQQRDHPTVVETRERIKRFGGAAAGKLVKLLAATA
ncbi:cation diffusion facilitator CzcD-associated flavoprotein CzcO [Rivibacter subsaxonicus]|uniref:Cation diffusion facilitator CzcD-associated flavoprotein CzcO n=2 Tax=Rivibacter subsaxonicus TaxID=457575 RepID=A0A4V2FTE4_9BURK|nr:cation diffusion facilitator CzcD-associated flavoprotein CzcO [Rivibacter subsaxonicus]